MHFVLHSANHFETNMISVVFEEEMPQYSLRYISSVTFNLLNVMQMQTLY